MGTSLAFSLDAGHSFNYGFCSHVDIALSRQKSCDAEFTLLTPSLHHGWGGDGRELTYKQLLYIPGILHIYIHLIFIVVLEREDQNSHFTGEK